MSQMSDDWEFQYDSVRPSASENNNPSLSSFLVVFAKATITISIAYAQWFELDP